MRPATKALDARKYRAVIVGSAVYLRHWDKGAIHYLKDQAPDLAERPTWFSVAARVAPPKSSTSTHRPSLPGLAVTSGPIR